MSARLFLIGIIVGLVALTLAFYATLIERFADASPFYTEVEPDILAKAIAMTPDCAKLGTSWTLQNVIDSVACILNAAIVKSAPNDANSKFDTLRPRTVSREASQATIIMDVVRPSKTHGFRVRVTATPDETSSWQIKDVSVLPMKVAPDTIVFDAASGADAFVGLGLTGACAAKGW
jgi:hypothetical protein